MKLKRLIYLICFVSFGLANTGCSGFLDVALDNEQEQSDYWKTKEAAKAVLMGAYVSMRADLPKFIQWGDLRADVMAIGPAAVANEDMNQMKNLSIQPDNEICKWNNTYTTIARCNSLIENVESVLLLDETFTQEQSDAYKAEAIWLRSLNYFNLVRTFKDVPYITWSYVTDKQDFYVEKSDGELILDNVLSDLKDNYSAIPKNYDDAWATHGRVTKGAYCALLADICLWTERYDEVLQWCDSLDALHMYSLMPKSTWFDMYFPGNAKENIFELQWSKAQSQTNSMFAWFHNVKSNGKQQDQTYTISPSGIAMFTETSDIRGLKGTYIADGRIWKYAGTTNNGTSLRSGTQYDNNWIFYRYADIKLMRAEAQIMLGDYKSSYDQILDVHTRAGGTADVLNAKVNNEAAALTQLMKQRALEFTFEGKRWFDLVRWASKKEYMYKDNLVQLLLANVSASMRPLYETKLLDVNGFYLPIHKDDIEASNGALDQNSYYE